MQCDYETKLVQSSSGDNSNVRQLRDRNQIKQTEFYGCSVSYLIEVLPENYSEAINSNDKRDWEAAMQDEIESLRENRTWILVEKPKAKKVLKSRWV